MKRAALCSSNYDETTTEPQTHSIRAEVCPNLHKKTLKKHSHTLGSQPAAREQKGLGQQALTALQLQIARKAFVAKLGGGRAPFIGEKGY